MLNVVFNVLTYLILPCYGVSFKISRGFKCWKNYLEQWPLATKPPE